MAYLTMLVIFHMNLIISQIFNLSHIYHIFAKKNSFFEINFFELVTWGVDEFR
jgi:hypothetical protein